MTRILFVHERRGIARAVETVLHAYGWAVDSVPTGVEADAALRARRYAVLVTDVAAAGVPGYELIGRAKALAADGSVGAPRVVLVSSVYRKTSYKRRPVRLYGADDYVEIHHLADMLPDKIGRLLALSPDVDAMTRQSVESRAADAFRDEGDARMESADLEGLAVTVVADVILYNGHRIVRSETVEEARAAVGDDLDIARDLVIQVAAARGLAPPSGDPVGDAFSRLLRELGRKDGPP